MIGRVLGFGVTFWAAVSLHDAGLPLWPAFLSLGVLAALASLALGRRRDAVGAAIMCLGILAMLLPFSGVWWHLWAVALWTVLAVVLGSFNKWAARLVVLMPIGYVALLFWPFDEVWLAIEILGVFAILLFGRALDEAVMAIGHWVGGLSGITSRRGDSPGSGGT